MGSYISVDLECPVCTTPFRAIRDNVLSGNTKSCGCRNKEQCRQIGLKRDHKIVHGQYNSKEYKSWEGMWSRCTNPKATGYKNYGGRGITVDPDWKSFSNFFRDMGKKPDGTSIDRVNNDGNYEFWNCRWATRKQQNNNTRRNTNVKTNS